MINWGKVPLASVLPFIFDSFDGGTGASITLTGLAVADIFIYKGGSMTQRASTSGFSIDTGDNTDAGFFVAGSFYTVVVASVTIDAQTVNFVAGTFWLGPTLTVAGVDEVDVTHWLGTACATPTTGGVDEVDITHWRGEQVSTTTVAGYPKVDTAYIGSTAQTGADLSVAINDIDNFVDTEVAAIKTKTDYLPSVTAGAAGGLMIAGSNATTTVNITGNLSGSVGSVTGAVGSVTGDVGGNVTGSVGSIASNGINNNSLHSNACSKITDSGIQRGASNWENNSDDRSLGWAISKLVNKIDLNAAGDTLTIRKSNDSTALFTQAVTTSGGAAPVVSLDTTG